MREQEKMYKQCGAHFACNNIVCSCNGILLAIILKESDHMPKAKS